jgi:hypothetical protein
MNPQRGKHDSRQLSSGFVVHLIQQPGSDKWRIRSIDISWGSPAAGALTTKTWFAEPLGIDKRDFSTPDDAYKFVDAHVKVTPPATQS